jgi:hypothetical protein
MLNILRKLLAPVSRILHPKYSVSRDTDVGGHRPSLFRSVSMKWIEICHLLGYSAVWHVYEPTIRKKLSPPSSGSKISQARNQLEQVARQNGQSVGIAIIHGPVGKRKGFCSVPIGSVLSFFRLTLQFAGFLLGCFSTLKMKVILFSETSAHIRTTRRYIPEDDTFHNYRCENLRSSLLGSKSKSNK